MEDQCFAERVIQPANFDELNPENVEEKIRNLGLFEDDYVSDDDTKVCHIFFFFFCKNKVNKWRSWARIYRYALKAGISTFFSTIPRKKKFIFTFKNEFLRKSFLRCRQS